MYSSFFPKKEIIYTSFTDNQKGLSAYFWLSMVIIFVFLPIHSDLSATVVLSFIISIIALKKSKKHIKILFSNKISIIFILFATTALISCAINTEFLSQYVRIVLWFVCLICGFIFSYIFPRHNFRFLGPMIIFFIFSSSLLLLLGSSQTITHNIWDGNRLMLLTMHPSRLGLYAVFSAMYCTHVLLTSQNKTTRVVSFFAVAFFCTLTYLSASRTILIFLPLGLATIVILRNIKNIIPTLVIMAILTSIAGMTIYLKKDSFYAQRILSAVANTTHDSTFRARLPIWDAGLAAFSSAPFLGQGVQSFLKFYDEYRPSHTDQWQKKFGTSGQMRTKHVHNLILGRLAETGILGTISFFAFYALSTWVICKGPRHYRWVGAFLIYYFLIGTFDDMLYRINDSFVFLVLGLAAGASGIFQKQDALQKQPAGTA